MIVLPISNEPCKLHNSQEFSSNGLNQNIFRLRFSDSVTHNIKKNLKFQEACNKTIAMVTITFLILFTVMVSAATERAGQSRFNSISVFCSFVKDVLPDLLVEKGKNKSSANTIISWCLLCRYQLAQFIVDAIQCMQCNFSGTFQPFIDQPAPTSRVQFMK